MTKQGSSKPEDLKYSLSRSEDGGVDILFRFPLDLIQETKKSVVESLRDKVNVPGFRKGKAPIEKVEAGIPENTIIEKVLSKLLPEALGKVLTAEKLSPAIYPKFELVETSSDKEWQVKAVTCEIPDIKLSDYKSAVKGIKAADTIWTPGKDEKPQKSPEQSKLEREQEILKVLLEQNKVKVPKLLVDEEVNSRLASLLSRIERLGLKLESYLASAGKTPESLRKEYESQAEQTIALDIILNKIAEEEKIEADKEKVEEAFNSIHSQPHIHDDRGEEEQKIVIESILKRRAAVDWLISLN